MTLLYQIFGAHLMIRIATALIILLSFNNNTTSNLNNNIPPSSVCTAQLLPDESEYLDYYCGWDWLEANDKCEYPCPSGLDADCPPLANGRKRRCIASAGCYARTKKVYWDGVISLSFDKDMHMPNNVVNPYVVVTTTPPPVVDGEDEETVEEEIVVNPPPPEMTTKDKEVLETLLQDYLFEALKGQLDVSSVELSYQEYDRPCVQIAVDWGEDYDVTKRTSLDIEIRVIGEYIPVNTESYTDAYFGEVILDSINLDARIGSFMNTVKQSSSFFGPLMDLYAIDEESVVETPSSSPSEPPTKSFDQSLDLRIDPGPTGSYGIVFTVRTPKGGNSILLKGMSFVTLHEGTLEYQVYTRLGSFQRIVGQTSLFELIASGITTGKGAKEYVPLLTDDTIVNGTKYKGFKPVHVPGNGAQRSIYITMTDRFKTDKDGPIPILFSYPIEDNEGERGYGRIDGNDNLEVYEGDGVLSFPWPKNGDGPYYRRPRGFIGSFDYDRNPCHPIENCK